MLPELTTTDLCSSAKTFAEIETGHDEPALYGVTDGKAVGTYLEQKFRLYLSKEFSFLEGNSARGIDFPSLNVDVKVTSIKQPQSSCPYKSARQKIFGLGYALLVFVYEKTDNSENRTGRLNIQHLIFVEEERTADFQTTIGIQKIMENGANEDDLVAFMQERMLPVDDIEATQIAQEILNGKEVNTGYLTISNALQWRLQYRRVINKAGEIAGIKRVK